MISVLQTYCTAHYLRYMEFYVNLQKPFNTYIANSMCRLVIYRSIIRKYA